MSSNNIKVAVGLSGGVDSAVSAYLLKSQGYEVTGVHMQCWDYSDETCKGNEDRSDAVSVCGQLDIKFKFLNFEHEYKSKVIDYFYAEYKAGRTPNPDVLCNREIKFGLFLDWAMREGFDYVATGHYARVACGGNAGATAFSPRVPIRLWRMPDSSNCRGTRPTPTYFHLLKGVDENKDQSYFLYRMTQDQLAKTLFPIGGMKKTEVRKIAKEQKLVVADKAESMGICFVGEVDINKFLKRQIEPKAGEVILKSTGEVIGRHEGVWFYTIGQRHGFEVTTYVGLPLYVVGKNVDQNQLIVGYYNDCLRDEFEVGDIHFIQENIMLGLQGQNLEDNRSVDLDHETTFSFDCDVRIRHLGQLYKAKITKSSQGFWRVRLEESAFGVAPGQSAVFYHGDEVLGGGVIG